MFGLLPHVLLACAWIRFDAQSLYEILGCAAQRLGHAIVVRPTTFFTWLWRAITPVMDPVTRDKVTFLTCTSDDDLLAALEKHMPRHVASAALTPVRYWSILPVPFQCFANCTVTCLPEHQPNMYYG